MRECPADRREKKLMIMGARRHRKEVIEELAECWSAEVAAAGGKAAACWLGQSGAACREASGIGYADDWSGGAGRLVGGG